MEISREQLVPLARRALVVALAGFLGWLAGDLLGIGEKFTAISAVIVSQAPSIGKSVVRTRRRVLGTVVGVIFGGLALWLIGSGPWQMFVAIFVAYAIAGLVGLGEGARVAALGALAVVIAPIGGPLHSAVLRFLDISIGAVIALAVTLLVYPRWAERQVVGGFAEIPERLSAALRPFLSVNCGLEAARRATGFQEEVSELRQRLIELTPLINQSKHEPGAKHRRPAVVAEALQRLLAASETVARELSRLDADAPPAMARACATLGTAVCDQLDTVSAAISAEEPIPAFPDSGPLAHDLYEQTEMLVAGSDATANLREELRLVAYSAELRRLAHLVDAMQGLAVEAGADEAA